MTTSRYPVLSPREIIRVLAKFDFVKVSQKGSHVKVKCKNSSRTAIIPMHNEIARGTLRSILEQAGLSLEEFNRFL